MVHTSMHKTITSPLNPGPRHQRACACGQHSGNGGECAACQKQRLSLQRQTVSPAAPDVAPPIVHEVLRSSGHPLDAGTRAFMEPRFGRDFSGVRVHTDAQAAASARAVNALAYTVGGHMAFGAGQYAPGTSAGQKLLAHELTHVVQQNGNAGLQTKLAIGRDDEPAEREADRVAETGAFFAAGVQPSQKTPLSLRRWRIAGTTATSNAPDDTLGGLAVRLTGRFNDWKCIRPLSMRTFAAGTASKHQENHYELFVQNGDQFDVSNLTATEGPSLFIYLFNDTSEALDANLAQFFYPGSVSSSLPDVAISNAAGDGKTPIKEFVIFGHAGGNRMWGGAGSFTPADFDPEDPAPTFGQAKLGLLPRRCWFTRNAHARSVGCDSEHWGRDFASIYLRRGAEIVTTTKSVRPTCRGTAVTSTGGCNSYNGTDFASGPSPGATSLDGPFWSASDFHAGRFWKTLKGRL